jgi:hypothetical protein
MVYRPIGLAILLLMLPVLPVRADDAEEARITKLQQELRSSVAGYCYEAFVFRDGKTWFPVHNGGVRDGYLDLHEFKLNEVNIIKRVDINDRNALSEIVEVRKVRCWTD